MTPARLKLFRRHENSCSGDGKTIDPVNGRSKPYEKEFRIYEEDTIRRKRRPVVADCSCTIYAEGTLYKKGVKMYLRSAPLIRILPLRSVPLVLSPWCASV
jgi:hypothetical protein